MSAKQWCVHRSKTCCQNLKHFNNVFLTGGNKNKMFESFTVHQIFFLKIKVLGPKGLNRIAKIGQGQGHLCLREENLSVINI